MISIDHVMTNTHKILAISRALLMRLNPGRTMAKVSQTPD